MSVGMASVSQNRDPLPYFLFELESQVMGGGRDVPANPSPRLSGLPSWRETFDIEAKAPANAVPFGLPESEKRGRVQAMIRRLLEDRFKLEMRVEQKTMPVYALSVASGGPNLQRSAIAERLRS